MNNKVLQFVVFLISAASIILILFQSLWINQSFGVKKLQFDKDVHNALHEVNEVIEHQEILKHSMDHIGPVTTNSYDFMGTQSITLEKGGNVIKTKQYKQRFFKLKDLDSLKIPRLSAYLGVDTITLNNSIHGFSNDKRDGGKRIFNDLLPVSKKLSNKTIMVEQVVNKLIRVEVDIEDRISKPYLDSIIRSRLLLNGINTGFVYRVFNNKGEDIFKTIDPDNYNHDNEYSIRLFPNDILSKPSYLHLSFPSRSSFLLNSLWPLLTASIVLTIIIISTFYYTLRIIFRQKKLSEIKNDFVNNMTHELKTPIATISLASQMLSDKSIPDEAKNYSSIGDIINKESKRLGFQVEKVLQMAVFDKGEIKLKRKDVDVNNIINNVVRNTQLIIEKADGELKVNLNAKETIVNLDEVHFTNIISNLLDNAVKYSKEKPVIELSTRNNKEGIFITIKDNGIGIKRDDLKRIFDQFYRVSTGNRHDVKGFGLGLSYVKKMVDFHKGAINVESEINRGTSFELFFPFRLKN
ncbi:MAG: HAMP domain-containing histidine kinase [Bacteroidales bacterium]|jgi:two-component system phosphate regulon sensor histidine kinase PhoR|nr:HAMP domain-containing histidine kinase [Bacteroidales bacterium]